MNFLVMVTSLQTLMSVGMSVPNFSKIINETSRLATGSSMNYKQLFMSRVWNCSAWPKPIYCILYVSENVSLIP